MFNRKIIQTTKSNTIGKREMASIKIIIKKSS